MFLKTWGVNKGAFVKWIVEAHELQWQVGPSHPAQECLGSAVYLQLSCHFSGGVSSALIWVLPGSHGIYQKPPLLLWFGVSICWLSSSFPLGMVTLLVAALLAVHLELGRVVRLSCLLPEALSLLNETLLDASTEKWSDVLSEDLAI